MAPSFPNHSRSYDTTRNAVRFWGYDSAMEISFFVTEDALRRLAPGLLSNEESLLQAFDQHRASICAAAGKIYKRGSKGSYELAASDF